MDDSGGDMDVEQCLIGQFSSMGTTDKDVLVGEFRKLLGFQLNTAGCEFFLDMTNWNLHAAIGAYYDFEMPSAKTPSMSFVRDITIGEGEAVPPDTNFTKTWRIQNSGDEKWPLGCSLRFVNGDRMGSPDWVAVADLPPSGMIDISVQMRSPSTPGIFQGQWRIFTRTMVPFGEIIWVIISVEAGGLLGVTQQMSQFASSLGSSGRNVFETPNSMDSNPFALSSNQNNSNIGYQSNTVPAVSFGPFKNSFRSIETDFVSKPATINYPQSSKQTYFSAHERTAAAAHELNLTAEKNADESPSTSCWNTKSPTFIGGSEDLIGTCHSLHRIDEETGMVADSNNNDENKTSFLSSSSSYDISARQASPYNSPSKLLELEQSFNSPDAPSPIRPSRELYVNQEETSTAAQRLDFASGS